MSVCVLSTLLTILALVLTRWLHSRVDLQPVVTPRQLPEGEDAPLISVIVPARNEERNIRRCVAALLAQSYPQLEVIVVDDCSQDDTPRILAEMAAAQPRLRVHRGEPLPAGWAGKPHALQQGARLARGEWLCFVDADTFAHPDLLSSVYLAAREHHADLFTILTDQELGSFWEKVVLPLVFIGLSFGFPADRVNDPTQAEAIANGQFILIRRQVYQALGGHAAIKNRIDEDKALAEVVKGAGYRLVFADGRTLARTRMYTSLAEMWEGWTKNIFLGLRDRLGLLLFGAVVALAGALALPVWLLLGFLWWQEAGGWQGVVVLLEAIVVWGYVILWRARGARAMH
ncbi:MAG: glycosyltransferase, partial [Anaerolineae bacterium]